MTSATTALRFAAVAVLLCTVGARDGLSQGQIRLDRWARSAGMGDAATAVFWGGDPDVSVNPALLGYHGGIRYSWDEREVLPGLGNATFFSQWVTLGQGGLGLAFTTGRFNDKGLLGLEPGGDIEKDWTAGAAVATAPVLEALAARAGREPPRWASYGDLALGYRRNTQRWFEPGGKEVGKLVSSDLGGLVRVTPIGSRGSRERARIQVRVDASYGLTVLNVGEAKWQNEDRAPDRWVRQGFASRVVSGWPRSPALPEWLLRLTDPVLSAGGAFDFDRDMKRWGGELCIANLLYLRRGYWDGKGIDGPTQGWGAGVQAGSLGGFRYDRAKVPQGFGPYAHHWSFTAFLDPVAIAGSVRRTARQE